LIEDDRREAVEMVEQLPPELEAGADALDQQQRRTLAGDAVADPEPFDLEEFARVTVP
jgi:ABC-type nitrate/sulfonate/bicarbonate transport system substrate-binding protein